ncbi:pentapeptide repeat protein [Pseudorhodoferax soli]|uniref:Pentapeptide repeat protein n=2 Tax=Pseudorhodoferax soli TaxID=545864 RepID=A0A368XJV0_9BURK|nr:pentapeptide repeat protein [Pseudorhodoferax soli]
MEVRKLRAEIAKIGADVRLARRSFSASQASAARAFAFERWKTIGTLVTAVVAVGGLLLTLNGQRAAHEAESSRRHSEAFFAAQRQFFDANPTSKLAAISTLSAYLGPQAPIHRDNAAQLLVALLEIEQNPTVISHIIATLAKHGSLAIVALLRQSNLQLQEQLIEGAKLLPEDFDTWERMDSDAPAIQALADRVQTNGKAIVDVLNAMFHRDRAVRGADLSNVVFALPTVKLSGYADERALQTFGGVSWSGRWTLGFARGIRFEETNFAGARLSWLAFEDCNFHNTQLDGARLVGTRFTRCSFSGSTSLNRFVATLQARAPRTACFFVWGPTFDDSSFAETALSPRKGKTVSHSHHAMWYVIQKSTPARYNVESRVTPAEAPGPCRPWLQ